MTPKTKEEALEQLRQKLMAKAQSTIQSIKSEVQIISSNDWDIFMEETSKPEPDEFRRMTGNPFLVKIAKEVIHEYKELFDTFFTESEKERLRTVNIEWMSKKAYRTFGVYYFTNGEAPTNRITINRFFIRLENLISMSPKSFQQTQAMKGIILHELAHIKWQNHGSQFNAFINQSYYTKFESDWMKKRETTIDIVEYYHSGKQIIITETHVMVFHHFVKVGQFRLPKK